MAKRSKKWKTNRGEVSAALARMPVANGADWLWGLILLLAVVLTYTPVFWAGYIWDDDLVLTSNPCMVGPLGLEEIWTTNAADICPLTLTTFWIEHALWGLAPLPYHVVNVLLHAAGAIVLWRVLQSLRVPGAWFGAALWALHPVMVESVAWISEMKNTESGLFYLLSILFFVKGLSTTSRYNRSGFDWNYALTLLFAALAMASKSSTVILPVVLCLCAWWLEGRWQWRNVIKITPVFLLSVVAGLISVWTQSLQIGANADPLWARTWSERLITAGNAIWFYLGKLFWPHPLVMIYPRWHIDSGQWFSYLPLISIIIVFFILWLKRKTWSASLLFVFGYFVSALLPALGLVRDTFSRYSFVADHFQYLASMGPLALVGATMLRWTDFCIPGRLWLRGTLAAGVLIFLGLLSWQRTLVYKDQETVWIDTLAQNHDCWLGYNDLGMISLSKGNLVEATTQFEKALELNHNYDLAHNNLGLALLQTGRINGAMIQFQKALDINHGFAEAHNNLGIALVRIGQIDGAMAQFQEALRLKPNDISAQKNLALARAIAQRANAK